jgi:hypothetical protein
MYNITAYIHPPVVRPTDPELAYPIFRNANAAQLTAGAELKATQAGYQGAYTHGSFGGGGEFAHVRDLAVALGGSCAQANGALPASIAALIGREPASRREADPAPAPRPHHALGGFTPAPPPLAHATRASKDHPGGGRTPSDDIFAEGRPTGRAEPPDGVNCATRAHHRRPTTARAPC